MTTLSCTAMVPAARPGQLWKPNTRLHRKTVEQPGAQPSRASPPKPSSAGWKMKSTVPLQLVSAAAAARRHRAAKPCPVMAAGMHHARCPGRRRQAGILGDRQRINLGAQADARLAHVPRVRVATMPWPPMPASKGMPSSVSFSCTKGGGLLFLKGQLRVRMKVPAPRGRLLVQLGGQGRGAFARRAAIAHA